MLHYPDHVGKSLFMKLAEIEKLEVDIAKISSRIITYRRRQAELLGEIKGMLQAEEFENEQRKAESKPE